GDITVEKPGEQVVKFLGEYLAARAVALFVRVDDRFVRIATTGVPTGAPIPTEVRRDDGLLGQVIAEDRGIEVNDLPDGYLYFGSSLGRAKPATVLIAPTREDNEVNGVLELGYLG